MALDAQKIRALDLPTSSKEFLLTRSIASSQPLLILFEDDDATFPTLQEYCHKRALPIGDADHDMYRIGTDEFLHLCIRKETGEVFAIDLHGRTANRFVNSSIELLLRFLEIYQAYGSEVRGLREEEADLHTRTVVAAMKRLDQRAFADSDSWWSLVTEQMEHGLL